ncbi:MAG: ATP-binding cassette domain-containing protein [Acidobacteria bacterium]|nr:ATP-binding cassette domain-containing protein [Acidobacteriota bacterium]
MAWVYVCAARPSAAGDPLTAHHSGDPLLRSYAYLFSRYRWAYVFGLIALVITNALSMAIPRVFGAAVDAFTTGADSRAVMMFAGMIMAIAVVQSLTRVVSRIVVLGASRRVEYDLKGLLHDKLVRLAPSFYEAFSTGDLMSRMTNDVMLVRALGGPGILYFANAVLVYLLGIGFMVSLNWQLTIVVLAPLPIMAWLVRGTVHKVRAYALSSREALSALNTVVQENLAGAEVVRSFALEEAQTRRFDERSTEYLDWALKESRSRAQMIPMIGMAGGLSYAAVLALGGPMAAAGTVTVGDLVAFVGYVSMLIFPTVALGWILSLMQRGRAALERLDRILRAPITVASRDGASPFQALERSIDIADYTFRYHDTLEPYRHLQDGEDAHERPAALSGVNLKVAAGDFVALVGRVGSGKSTLLKSLLRLVEVPDGAIKIDDVDINDYDVADLRRAVAYVPQDDFLFSDTVAANIRFGAPDANDGAVAGAAELAGIDVSSEGLSQGLETQVGERGANLSGGQRQRVALARALLREAPILILDNALSNVDTDTERRILAGLASHRTRRTVIAASNRITAVQEADRIFVFDAGEIVDAGNGDDLASRPGLYATMREQQQLSARLEEFG